MKGRWPCWPAGESWRPPVHELGLVSEAAARVLEGTEGRRLTAVVLGVGSGAAREVVAAAWARVTAGTEAEAAAVTWVEIADTLQCFACGAAYHGGKLDVCPSCGGNGLVVDAAPDFSILDWSTEGPI